MIVCFQKKQKCESVTVAAGDQQHSTAWVSQFFPLHYLFGFLPFYNLISFKVFFFICGYLKQYLDVLITRDGSSSGALKNFSKSLPKYDWFTEDKRNRKCPEEPCIGNRKRVCFMNNAWQTNILIEPLNIFKKCVCFKNIQECMTNHCLPSGKLNSPFKTFQLLFIHSLLQRQLLKGDENY